ncbi:hypothetical protein Tco_1120084 [Tanacetum coccineum]
MSLAFRRLRPDLKTNDAGTTPLIGFSVEYFGQLGKIQLTVRIGDEEHSTSAWMNFVVVRSPSPYNEIIGRPTVRKLQAVSSTAHEMLKLPVEGGITILKTNTPYPSRKIWRIRACTHQIPQKNNAQYAVSRGLNTPYSRYGINIIFWKISSVVPTPRNPQYAVSNTWIRRIEPTSRPYK